MLKHIMNNIDFQKRAMDASSLKHEVISNNIANIETPGYKRKRVVFEELLSDTMEQRKLRMKKTNAMHMDSPMESAPFYVETDRGMSERIDGNSVNIDIEMAEEAKNNIKYNALINQTSGQIRRLRSAIRGGK